MEEYLISGAGTNGWSDDSPGKPSEARRWWQNDSLFNKYIFDGTPFKRYDDPFIWNTNLGGVEFWRRWPIINKFAAKDEDHRDWISAGAAFTYYCDAYFQGCKKIVIAHSHFYQVVAYACARYGLHIDRLVTVSSPIRLGDMKETYEQARKNIDKHLHIYDGGRLKDKIQLLGELGDGKFGIQKECPFADYNDSAGNNHSKILSNPDDFKLWDTCNWKYFLQTGNLNKESAYEVTK